MDDMTIEERAAIRQRAYAALEDSEDIKARLQERRAASVGRGEASWPLPQQPAPRSARHRAPQRPLAQSQQEWEAGWNKWAQTVADQRIKALVDRELLPMADEIGAHVGKLQKRIRELEGRLEKTETATVQLITELEREIKELRERAMLRPVRPTLVIDG